MHRLVQIALQTDLSADEAGETAARAVRLVRAAFPDQPWRPATWPRCGTVLPHALAATRHAAGHQVALDAAAELLRHVGIYLWYRAELHAARQHLDQAVAIATRAHGPDHPDVGHALMDLGIVLADLGDLTTAREASERTVAIYEAAFGPDHPEVGIALLNLGANLRLSVISWRHNHGSNAPSQSSKAPTGPSSRCAAMARPDSGDHRPTRGRRPRTARTRHGLRGGPFWT